MSSASATFGCRIIKETSRPVKPSKVVNILDYISNTIKFADVRFVIIIKIAIIRKTALSPLFRPKEMTFSKFIDRLCACHLNNRYPISQIIGKLKRYLQNKI